MRKRMITALVAGVATFAVAGAAYAAVTVSFSATFSPSKAKKPTGLNVDVKSTDPAAEQPPIMNRIVIKL